MWQQNLATAVEWTKANWAIVTLAGLVFVQFVGFQALLIHYTLFRRSLVRPRPDGLRFQQIERTIAFQAEQIDKIFEKLAEARRDLAAWTKAEPKVAQNISAPNVSLESSFLSLGELNLKKKLESWSRN